MSVQKMRLVCLEVCPGELVTDNDDNNNNNDDDNDTRQTIHDCIGSFGFAPNEPTRFRACN